MTQSHVQLVDELFESYMFRRNPLSIDKIGFFNCGYWKGVNNSVEIAQINLIETLIEFFSVRSGNILDVACGKGASTKFLTKYFDPQHVTGINISEHQLQVCRAIAPECTFKLMDAVSLEFEDSSFDNILCIEGAMHFKTRRRFLEEAHRILRPGGRLAISDLLIDYDVLENVVRGGRAGELSREQRIIVDSMPKENYLPDLDAYRNDMVEAGFKYVRVEDITEYYAKGLKRYEAKKAENEFDKKRDYSLLNGIVRAVNGPDLFSAGCFAYAIK